MTDIKAKTISDSIGEHSPRLWTVETRVPQMIHQEILRHRRIITEEGLSVLGLGWEPDFSYSVSSTRAVPFAKMVQEAMDDDLRAAPIHWGRANKGMVPGDELDDIEKNIWWPTVVLGLGLRGGDEIPQEFITRMECAERLWRISAWFAATAAKQMVNHCDPHKSIPNRMIAPYTHYNVLMTGTEPGWLNLFGLRLDSAADPIVRALAEILWREWNESKPKTLRLREWHLPYADDDQSYEEISIYMAKNPCATDVALDFLKPMSVARCAHLSYSSFETGDRMTVNQCINLHNRLVGSVPIHCYDDETEVLTNEGFKFWRDLKGTELLGNVDHETGKFLGFCIPEEFICKYYSGQVYDYNDKDIDLVVTPNHNLYAHSIRVYNDRFTLFPKLFQANYPASLKSRYDTVGECAMKMLSCTSGTIGNNKFELGHMNGYCFGQLCGFFIGDGYANLDITGRNSISFHLRRPRKILYLNEICRKLNLELMTTKELYKVKFPNIGNVFRESFYNDCKEKTMPLNFFSCSEDFLLGVLDGLRNSDGSTKRNTWVYSTKSSELSERIRIIGTIVGQSFSVTGKDKKGTIILNAATKKYILVNDPRKDRVKIRQYEGNVYCASVPGKVLVVRRNGRIILSGNSSPAEHQATPDFWINNPLIITIMGENNLSPESAWNSDRIWCNHSKSGNLGPGWVQYRKLLPNEAVAPLPKAYR